MKNIFIVFKSAFFKTKKQLTGRHKLDFCCTLNNSQNVSQKSTQIDTKRATGKENNSNQPVKNSDWSNNLRVLDSIRLDNVCRLIIDYFNMQSLENKFEILQEIVKNKLVKFVWLLTLSNWPKRSVEKKCHNLVDGRLVTILAGRRRKI